MEALALNKYVILNVFLDGVPKIPYADGIGGFRGACGHATANYGAGEQEDTANSEKNWEQGHWEDAFVHYFCDYNTILDVADNNYISYGCSGGNPYFVNFELCQTKDPVRFAASYDRWVWAMAYVLYSHKLGVVDGKTLVSHRWVSQHYSGTHDDPHAYIESHGKTWTDVVNDVTSYYNQFEGEEKMLQELIDRLKVAEDEIVQLKNLSIQNVPSFAKPSADKLLTLLQSKGKTYQEEGGSYDFYRVITILDRAGIFG